MNGNSDILIILGCGARESLRIQKRSGHLHFINGVEVSVDAHEDEGRDNIHADRDLNQAESGLPSDRSMN